MSTEVPYVPRYSDSFPASSHRTVGTAPSFLQTHFLKRYNDFESVHENNVFPLTAKCKSVTENTSSKYMKITFFLLQQNVKV